MAAWRLSITTSIPKADTASSNTERSGTVRHGQQISGPRARIVYTQDANGYRRTREERTGLVVFYFIFHQHKYSLLTMLAWACVGFLFSFSMCHSASDDDFSRIFYSLRPTEKPVSCLWKREEGRGGEGLLFAGDPSCCLIMDYGCLPISCNELMTESKRPSSLTVTNTKT